MSDPTHPDPSVTDSDSPDSHSPDSHSPDSSAENEVEEHPVEDQLDENQLSENRLSEDQLEDPAEEPQDQVEDVESADESAPAEEADPEAETEPEDESESVDEVEVPEESIGSEPETSDTEDESASAQEEQAPEPGPEPELRTGVAPIINVPAEQDKSLGGFFDTLDERAKNWWETYQIRQARKKVLAAKSAEREAAKKDAEETAAAAHRAREHEHESVLPGEAPATSTPQLGLPKPPPAEERPAGQLFTGSIPVIAAQDDQPRTPAGPVGDEDQTTVIPAYRDPEPAPLVSSGDPEEQRRRTVIAEKAEAIERATSESGSAPYAEAGYIGASYRQDYYEPADDEEDLYTYIPPYNLPSRDADPEPTQWDLARRIFVTAGALAAVLSALWMFGWFSSSEESPAILTQSGLQETYAEGWFSGEQALLSPDHHWYWLWPLVALGLVIHALYQWRPSQQSTPRQQRTGWFVGASSGLMLVLTAALYAGNFTLTAISAAGIAIALTLTVRQFNLYTARSDTERQFTDDVVGLFYGFSLIQVMSALSVWLTQRGWDIPGVPTLFWALGGLVLAVWIAAFYSMTERGRISIALGLAWGLFWLVFPRILGEVTSVWIALGAALGAFIVILCTQSRRYRINHAERRAAMGRPLEDII